MIIKYFDDGAWTFVPTQEDVAVYGFDMDELVRKYDGKTDGEKENDFVAENDGVFYTDRVARSNKAFVEANSEINGKILREISTHNAIDGGSRNTTIAGIVFGDRAIITNQGAFLMNDNGKTIDRLS